MICNDLPESAIDECKNIFATRWGIVAVAFAMIGALVFLGCLWRAVLRLAGGDGNAIL